MTYADITTNDRNPVKSWLQRRRLDDALWYVQHSTPRTWDGAMLDFGGGDGGLCARVKDRYPHASVTCYEPAAEIRKEAESALQGTGVLVTASLDPTSRYDLITCCEVFEHLPAQASSAALDTIKNALTPAGTAVLGVPNEIFAVGLLKGLFRMTRRYGQYDARWDTVLAAAAGRPKQDRPHLGIDGMPFIYPHTGFDFRVLRAQLAAHGLQPKRVYGSPLHRWPQAVNSEVYLVCRSHG